MFRSARSFIPYLPTAKGRKISDSQNDIAINQENKCRIFNKWHIQSVECIKRQNWKLLVNVNNLTIWKRKYNIDVLLIRVSISWPTSLKLRQSFFVPHYSGNFIQNVNKGCHHQFFIWKKWLINWIRCTWKPSNK